MNPLANKLDEIRTFLSSLHGEVNELERSYSEVLAVLQNLEQRLENSADRDDLTGLLRRKAFFRKWQELLERCARAGQACSILMVDIDHFKKINDTHGHATGDQVLRRVARLLDAFASGNPDKRLAGRFGGEEFVLALAAGEDEALQLAEELRREVEKAPGPISCTISIGLGSDVEAADRALYEAKRSGRNRVAKAGLSLVKNTG